MAWSLWSACDESGLQMRSRVCGAQGGAPCVGNSTQRRDCNEIPGESVPTRLGGPLASALGSLGWFSPHVETPTIIKYNHRRFKVPQAAAQSFAS